MRISPGKPAAFSRGMKGGSFPFFQIKAAFVKINAMSNERFI
jgi:hypothetical protein